MWGTDIFHDPALVFRENTDIVVTLISGVGWATYMIIRDTISEKQRRSPRINYCSMALGALMLLGATVLTNNITSITFDDGL
ncbi:MAG: hypothetical protein J7L38_08495 [Thermoproteales archaeon]|nr:hypothetical protein [Thermoproteales archaeon]